MKKIRIRPAGLLCIAIGSGVTVAHAVADESDHRFYISPMGSYTLKDSDRGTKNGYGGSLAVGKRITNSIDLEALGIFTSYQGRNGNGSTSLYGGGLGANVYPFSASPTLGDFYVRLAVQRGQGKKEPGPISDYSTTLFDAGVGYNLVLSKSGFGPFSPGLALRLEALYRHDAHGHAELGGTGGTGHQYFQEAVFNIGFRIPLGGSPAAETPLPTEPVQVVPVEEVAAPPAETPPPPPPPCEPPVPGQPINLEGCKAGDSFVLRGVNFEFNKATLTVNAKALLDPVADALLARPAVKVEVDGHTDSKGSDAYNLKLSDRRAASVMQYLAGRGVAADRMASKGFGESKPVADNNTDEGRELNRRVELKITDDGSSAAAAPAAAEAAAPAAEAAPAEPAATAAEPAPAEAAPAEAAPAPEAAAPAEAAPAEAAPAEAAPAEAAPAEAPPADAAPAQ